MEYEIMDNDGVRDEYRSGWHYYAWAALSVLVDQVPENERELVSQLLMCMVNDDENKIDALMDDFATHYSPILSRGQRAITELFYIEWETPTSKRKSNVLAHEAVIALLGVPDNVLIAVANMIREDYQNDNRTQLPTVNELVGYCRAASLPK